MVLSSAKETRTILRFFFLFLLGFWLPFLALPGSSFSPGRLEAKELPGSFIDKLSDEQLLIDTHNTEKLRFGLSSHINYYKVKKTKNTVVEQRSGRKRLYDHNLILRAIFRNQIIHKKYGGLGNLLKGAVYIDFGSAILYEEGAVTVRDLYEDNLVRPNVSEIVATDINDPNYDHTRYIEIHIKERDPFPFSFTEIPQLMDNPEWLKVLVESYARDHLTPVIFRSTNSGPDLFYTVDEMKKHFISILKANPDRNVLYFFNRFVFFRFACENKYELIGRIDEKIGVNHSYSAWRFVDWQRRSLDEAFLPSFDYVSIGNEAESPIADRWDSYLQNRQCWFKKTSDHWKKKFDAKLPGY